MSDDGKPVDPERTVMFTPPKPEHPPEETPVGEATTWLPGPPAQPQPPREAELPLSPPPPKASGHEMIGSLLNHIFRVDRFIAAGGMGAVYEGINVNTDERVAIKIILPHLTADPNIQALFRNEARTLTQLSHQALVQYRVLAQEPSLGVFYIVTEFIDGPPLSDFVAEHKVTPDELRRLAIRLASGLAAAHDLGKVHRDLSPDNVLLPGGSLDQAKIIDFGIAKDLSAANKTVIGSSFAGKFAFVAPEQFGDSRDVGPWTDVYSLGLVLLAVALGKTPPMGTTITGAIEARLKVPDLSAIPQELRPVVAKMLEPDRAKRLGSMREVVEALGPSAARTEQKNDPMAQVIDLLARLEAKLGVPRTLIAGAGGAVVLALVFVIVMLLWPSGAPPQPPLTPGGSGQVSATPGEELVRRAVEGSLSQIACSWIDIDYPERGADGVRVSAHGVYGDPAGEAIAARLERAARSADAKASVDAGGVFPIAAKACGLLDAFRQFREPSSQVGRGLIVKQPQFHLQANSQVCGANQAQIVMDIRIGDPGKDFSIVAMDGNGGVQQLFVDRARFDSFRQSNPQLVTDLGNDTYRWSFCTDEATARASPQGLAGIELVKGRGPFDLGLNPNATEIQTVSADWPARFIERARARGWTTQMAWYQVLAN